MEMKVMHLFTNWFAKILLKSPNIQQRRESLPSVIQYREFFNRADSVMMLTLASCRSYPSSALPTGSLSRFGHDDDH